MVREILTQAIQYWPDLILGLRNTFVMTLLAFGASLVGGLILGLGSVSRRRLPRLLTKAYVDFFRGIPLLVLLWLVYFGLPSFPVRPVLISPGGAVFLAFALSFSAFQAEIFRAGILSVDRGQVEAAVALGMRYRQIIRRIVLPQAVRVMAPPTVNQFTDVIKSTAMAGTVAYSELFRTAYLMGTETFRFLPPFLLIASIYVVICLPLIYWVNALERRLKLGTAY